MSGSLSGLARGKAATPAPPPPSDDIIFVKRRTASRTVVLLPEEEADVRWKETLYLNLLVQLHCELTVAVCTKTVSADGRSTMQAQRHVTKRVYASPSKTRMDKKGLPGASGPVRGGGSRPCNAAAVRAGARRAHAVLLRPRVLVLVPAHLERRAAQREGRRGGAGHPAAVGQRGEGVPPVG